MIHSPANKSLENEITAVVVPLRTSHSIGNTYGLSKIDIIRNYYQQSQLSNTRSYE